MRVVNVNVFNFHIRFSTRKESISSGRVQEEIHFLLSRRDRYGFSVCLNVFVLGNYMSREPDRFQGSKLC